MTPFIVRFAEPLAQSSLRQARYDAKRQVTQILVEGLWIDAPDTSAQAFKDTHFTRVGGETSDDV
jgi:hypothetical protein